MANAAPYLDRRPDLAALRERQREFGNVPGTELTTRELEHEEAKAVTHTPVFSTPIGGMRVIPLPDRAT